MKLEMKDSPGQLVAALKPISEVGGNIIAVIHQRDPEVERPTNVSVFDRRDSRQEMESVMVRMIYNKEKLKKIQLIPVTIDDEGPLYGTPRLASTKRAAAVSGEI